MVRVCERTRTRGGNGVDPSGHKRECSGATTQSHRQGALLTTPCTHLSVRRLMLALANYVSVASATDPEAAATAQKRGRRCDGHPGTQPLQVRAPRNESQSHRGHNSRTCRRGAPHARRHNSTLVHYPRTRQGGRNPKGRRNTRTARSGCVMATTCTPTRAHVLALFPFKSWTSVGAAINLSSAPHPRINIACRGPNKNSFDTAPLRSAHAGASRAAQAELGSQLAGPVDCKLAVRAVGVGVG